MKKQLIQLTKSELNQLIAKMKKDIRLKELWDTMEQRNLTVGEREIARIILETDYNITLE